MTVCEWCYHGFHGQCIGSGCECECQLCLDEHEDHTADSDLDEDYEFSDERMDDLEGR